ncbi:hypothetical protein [Methanobrevibacter sp. V14]|uniref:hypothetical protein n=1 Tax=Methanobrevibacter sp. V14 TaxID=3064280 RepID=UPI0027373E0A|nr:hypothetical protein [Methanobrevibacter sp. V14]
MKDFNKLKFSIIVKNSGELIEDYLNIHKGNRKDKFEGNLKEELSILIKNHHHENEIKNKIKEISKYSFFINLSNRNDNNLNEIENMIRWYDASLINYIQDYWFDPIINFNYNKQWLNTQINKQRLINPYFSIYLISEDISGEFSLNNIKNSLINPKRPLYLGESDDIVNIINISIVEINENNSSKVISIVPGIYQCSDLIKLPINIKFDNSKESLTICSIPKGDLGESIKCYEYNDENFVFYEIFLTIFFNLIIIQVNDIMKIIAKSNGTSLKRHSMDSYKIMDIILESDKELF